MFWKHALRYAAIPLVTLVGLGLPFVFSGAVATEVVFGWPGMGRVTVDAIFARDYPVILATTMISAFLVVLGNFLPTWATPGSITDPGALIVAASSLLARLALCLPALGLLLRGSEFPDWLGGERGLDATLSSWGALLLAGLVWTPPRLHWPASHGGRAL